MIRQATPVEETPRPQFRTLAYIQRIGQDVFREALVDLWGGRCAVTGLDQPELLRASHIKPWAKCDSDAERLDPLNGLLLGPHWDLAFDSGLVTFEDDGKARLSTRLTPTALTLLAPDLSVFPKVTALKQGHGVYLRFHREHIWQE